MNTIDINTKNKKIKNKDILIGMNINELEKWSIKIV